MKSPPFQVRQAEWTFGGRNYPRLTTDHFDILTTSTDPLLRRNLPRILESAYQVYSEILSAPDGPLDGAKPMRTYLFRNRSQWRTFIAEHVPDQWAFAGRVTSGGFSVGTEAYLYDVGRSPTVAILVHEGFHQYVAGHFDTPLPPWLGEGLAAYCEPINFRDDDVTFTPRRNSYRIEHLRSAFVGDTVLRLRDLLRTDPAHVIRHNSAERVRSVYAQFWALTVFLRHEADGRYASAFDRIARDLADNSLRIKAQSARAVAPNPAGTDYGEAVFRAYVTDDLDPFERQFVEFMHKLAFE